MNFDKPPAPPQEHKEQEASRTKKILTMLNELPFAKGGRAGDIRNWHMTVDLLSKKDFASLDEFVGAIETELYSKEWIDKVRPVKIMEYVGEMADIIKAWQEKK